MRNTTLVLMVGLLLSKNAFSTEEYRSALAVISPQAMQVTVDYEKASGVALSDKEIMPFINSAPPTNRMVLKNVCDECYQAVVMYEVTASGRYMGNGELKQFLGTETYKSFLDYVKLTAKD